MFLYPKYFFHAEILFLEQMLSGEIILNDLGGRPAISATLVAVLPPFLVVYFEERAPKSCDAC